jgi:hypothetical protein
MDAALVENEMQHRCIPLDVHNPEDSRAARNPSKLDLSCRRREGNHVRRCRRCRRPLMMFG